jgi:hypothetical protein
VKNQPKPLDNQLITRMALGRRRFDEYLIGKLPDPSDLSVQASVGRPTPEHTYQSMLAA